MKTKKTAEFGDFQTPDGLAWEVCQLLAASGIKPAALLEPTCGLGAFLFSALDTFESATKAMGVEINADYIKEAKATLGQRRDAERVEVAHKDFFVTDWAKVVAALPEPLLIIGNLPWVTNADLGALGSRNLPTKSNFQKRNGFDAVTGKANFDISEWMLIRLLEAMNGRRGTLAILCKASVARKALYHGWKSSLSLERSAIYRINAALHFNAAVEAVLLVTHFEPGARDWKANVFPRLYIRDKPIIIGYQDDMLLANFTAYHKWKHLCGVERIRWRSGVKHDCSTVMEVRREGKRFRNGLGEVVELEDAYIYPMLKSSDLANGRVNNESRWMIVTQTAVGAATTGIKKSAPRTWAYLNAHAELLNKRRSSIYKNRPAFCIFGIGDYSFAPWKVAISGFYKRLVFITIGPCHNKPVVLDDTCYFLPCQTKQQADYLVELLNSSAAQAFYNAFVFWDTKRPITAELLRRLDLRTLAAQLGSTKVFDAYFGGVAADSLTRSVGVATARKKGMHRKSLSPTLWSEEEVPDTGARADDAKTSTFHP